MLNSILMSAEYQKALSKAEQQLAEEKRELQHRQVRIARLEQTVAALRALTDPEYQSELGLTDAVREVLKTSTYALRPVDIRARVEAGGVNLAHHVNPMASLHAIITRLLNSKEVIEAFLPTGKPVYWWTENGPPVFTFLPEVTTLPPQLASTSGTFGPVTGKPNKKR